ncbi:hypothetical protein MGWOODY_Smn1730 [hydrothermal vent metagenome]|uniref:Uncharacterized protein n=1 Tax=hydrothermal vent metagenome TaxID=652676 RepID=A0A161K0K1_9ZZZZ
MQISARKPIGEDRDRMKEQRGGRVGSFTKTARCARKTPRHSLEIRCR